jgi:phage I-like protein
MPQDDALKLICLKAPAPQFDASKGEAGLPQRILIMPWGENDTAQGKTTVNDTTLKQLSAYNAAKNWDRPALDFEHNSVPGSPTYKGEPVSVAGYGTLEVVKGEGIYLLMSSWTEDGKKYAAGGHYGDLSPVVKTNDKGEVIGCHSAALCRHGATHGLIFLSATSHTKTMEKDKAPQNPEELFAALRSTLGLNADATPLQVLEGLTVRLAAPTAKTEPGTGNAEPGTAEMKALVSRLDKQDEVLKTLSSQIEARDRAEIEAQALREGKELPKSAKALPVEKLRLLAAELPVTVPMEKRTPEFIALSSAAKADSAELAAVSKATGVTEEDRKKYLVG